MRSFVVLFIVALLVTTVVSGLMAFLLPFDFGVTRVHAVAAPVFGIFAACHIFQNRKSLSRYLFGKHRKPLLAACSAMGVITALLYFNVGPVSAWMGQSYEQRRADVIFRPSEEVVTRRLNGRIEVKRHNERVMVWVDATLAGEQQHVSIWMEDDEGRLLDTIYLDEELMFRESITTDEVETKRSELLPVWWHRWQQHKRGIAAEEGLDATSGPTMKEGFDFSALVESQQPRFQLMVEVSKIGAPSQVFSAAIDLDLLQRHYLANLLGVGTARGLLSYDTSELELDDLLIDGGLISIEDKRPHSP
jgi:hypothetical protein